MNYIEISINNHGYNTNVFIDNKTKKININGVEKNILQEEIDKLIRIIRNWESDYSTSKIIDAEKFIITINTEQENDTIKGNGNYSLNYSALKDWISEINERNNL